MTYWFNKYRYLIMLLLFVVVTHCVCANQTEFQINVVVSTASTVKVTVDSDSVTAGMPVNVTLKTYRKDGVTVDTLFAGTKKVTITGQQTATDGSYGKYDSTSLAASSSFDVAFTNGMANFNLTLNKAAAQTIQFDVEDVVNPDGNVALNVGAASPADLQIATQPEPSSMPGGGELKTQPIVNVVDQFGNLTSSTMTITASQKAGSGDWTFGGRDFAVQAVSGQAAFESLSAANFTASDILTAAISFVGDGGMNVDSNEFAIIAGVQPPGNALSFNLANDFVLVPDNDSLDLTDQLSLEIWVKPDDVSTIQYLMKKGNEATNGHYGLYLNNDTVMFDLFQNHLYSISSSIPIRADKWTHIAATWDGSDMYLYLNGQLAASGEFTGALTANDSDFLLGAGAASPVIIEKFKGTLDEARVWQTSRSAIDIRNTMCRTITDVDSDLAAYYRFDQGAAGSGNPTVTTLFDASGKNNNGTLNNFTLAGSLSNWIASDAFNVWTGHDGADWHNVANWSLGVEPGASDNIAIPANATVPEMSADAACNHIIICDNASVNTNGNILNVNGNFINGDPDNNSILTGNSTVVLDGSDQFIAGETEFYNLIKESSDASTLYFEEGKTQTIANQLYFEGTDGALMRLKSDTDNERWQLVTKGDNHLYYLDVQDSEKLITAESPDQIEAYYSNGKDANNVGWDFKWPPAIITLTASGIGPEQITGNGEITDIGTSDPTERGFCWQVYDAGDEPNIVDDGKFSETDSAYPAEIYALSEAGFSPETQYQIRAYAVNSDGLGYGETLSFWTLSQTPDSSGVVVEATPLDSENIQFDFTAAQDGTNVAGYIVVRRRGSTPDLTTIQNGNEPGELTLNTGAEIVTVVTDPAQVTFTDSDLDAGMTYYYSLLAYNHNGINKETYNYNVADAKHSSAETYLAAPTLQARLITFEADAQGVVDVDWTKGDGQRRLVKINKANSFTAPVNGSSYVANPAYIGSGEQVVYNGSGNSVTITNLDDDATYWLRIYEYNNTDVHAVYLTTTTSGNPGSVYPCIVDLNTASATPVAGAANDLTITLNAPDDSTVLTDRTGAYLVTISGFEEAPDNSYGSVNGNVVSGDSFQQLVNFTNGVTTVELVLNNADLQQLKVSVADTLISGNIEITPVAGALEQILVTTQPRGSLNAGGGELLVQPVVQLLDIYENVITNDTYGITASKYGSTDWDIGGTFVIDSSDGNGTFTNLTASNNTYEDIENARIRFVSSSKTVVSNAFTILAKPPAKVIEYSNDFFSETLDNDGRIGNTLTITLHNSTFVSGIAPGSHVTLTNVPDGLTPVFTRLANNQLMLALNGYADEHMVYNSIDNLKVSFADSAFTSGDAATITGSEKELKVDFVSKPVAGSGRALQFNGNGIVAIDYVDGLTNTFTLETWVFTQEADATLINGNSNGIRLTLIDGRPVLDVRDILAAPLTGITSINDQKWHHLAVSFDGTKCFIYIDGQKDNEAVTSGSLSVLSNELALGESYGNPDFSGWLDEIRFWNIARDEAEINSSLHAGLAGNEPGLIGYWRCDETQGTTIYDATTGKHNGSLADMGENPFTTSSIWNAFTIDEDSSLSLDLTGYSQSGRSVTYQIAKLPEHGTLTGSVPAITYTPYENWNGDDSITYQVSDGVLTDQFTVSISTAAVDDPPVIANQIANVAVEKNADNTTLDLENVFTDYDNDDSAIVKTVISNTNPGLVDATIIGNNLILDYHLNKYGTAVITIRVTSNGKSVDCSFHVTVNFIDNTPFVANPINNVTVTKNAADTVIDLTNVFEDLDNDKADMTYSVVDNTNSSLVQCAVNDRKLSLKYGYNKYGASEVTVQASSNGKVVDNKFAVTVNNVDFPPYVTNALPDLSVAENSPVKAIDISQVFGDIDSDISAMSYSAVSGDTDLVMASIVGKSLYLEFRTEQVGETYVVLSGDSNGLQAEDSFKVTVNGIHKDDLSFRVIPADSGTVSPSADIKIYPGKSFSISATPNNEYQFVRWVTSSNVKVDEPYAAQATVIIAEDGDADIIAYFSSAVGHEAVAYVFSSPVGCGTVSPFGKKKVAAGERLSLAASPDSGYSFSCWTTSGNAIIVDPTAQHTSAILFGSSLIMANFKRSDVPVEFSVSASPENGGEVVVAEGTETACLGELKTLTAIAADGYKFTRWEVDGMGVVKDCYQAESSVVLKGNAKVEAVFLPESEAHNLTLKVVTSGGGIVSTRNLLRASDVANTTTADDTSFDFKDILTGGGQEVNIQAGSFADHLFCGWTVSDSAAISNLNSKDTSVKATGDATVVANFAKADGSIEGVKTLIKIMVKRKVNNSDKMMIKNAALPEMEFDPREDPITIIVDGTQFEINTDSGTFKQHKVKPIYAYKSHDKKFKLKLDFDKKLWSFNASKVDLSSVDNMDGVDVVLKIGDTHFGDNFDMKEANRWAFSKNDQMHSLSAAGSEISSFTIDKVVTKFDGDVEAKNKIMIKLSNVFLPTDVTFDPLVDAVTVRLGDIAFILPPGSMETKKEGQYQYLDKERGILSKLDLNKGKWAITLAQKNAWLRIRNERNVNFRFMIGTAQGAKKLIIINDSTKYQHKSW